MRKPRLDVLAHLDGLFVQERLAVIEEIDPAERGSDLVYDAAEEIEVEHPRLTRPGDPGLGRAAGLRARNVAGRCAFDVHAVGIGSSIKRANDRRLIFTERPLQRAVAAEFRSAGVEVLP